jgi:uncharacterized protein (DUF934 family)
MARVGFNAFEVKKDADAQAFQHALHEFSGLYQPAITASGGIRGRFPLPDS